MSGRPRVTIVVNRGGIQARRAAALAARMADVLAVEVVTEPRLRSGVRTPHRSDLVYVIDPGRRGFPAAVAGRLRRRAVVVEVGDPQAALYRAQGRSHLAVGTGAAIDAAVGRWATAAVVRGWRLADELRLRVPWVAVPDGVDPTLFRPVDDGLRRRLGLRADALVVGVVGSLNVRKDGMPSYGLDVIDALAATDDRVMGLVVGDGPGTVALHRLAVERGVARRLVLAGRLPHDEVPAAISAMDVCLSTQSDDAIGRGRTTAKLPEYLACDRFVLATDVGTAVDVLPPAMRVAPGEGYAERVATRLQELVERRAELRAGAGTRELALAHFDYELLAQRLSAFLLAQVA